MELAELTGKLRDSLSINGIQFPHTLHAPWSSSYASPTTDTVIDSPIVFGRKMHIFLDPLILLTAWAHVVLSPHTKVEESFNLHAVHDILMYGIGPNEIPNYDHFTFPGAVPRTFIGSVLLGWVVTPVMIIANRFGMIRSKQDMQLVVRLVLATINAVGFCLLRKSVSRRIGQYASVAFTLFTITQFHIPFWMGRTLPNSFALFLVNLAYFCLLPRTMRAINPFKSRLLIALSLLTFATVVFRSELLLLLGPIALQALLRRQIDFVSLVLFGLIGALTSILITILVDSYFWDTFPLFPEFSSLIFNVYHNKSSEWGVSPAHFYLTSSLPKLLLTALPFSLLGVLVSPKSRLLMWPSLAFIAGLSMLGHKEWRFIAYTVPAFNIAAAAGVQWCFTRTPMFRRTLKLVVSLCFLVNLAATILSTLASRANYPGGHAMVLFHQLYQRDQIETLHLHIPNLAAQSGASLFMHLNAHPYPPLSLCAAPRCHPPLHYLEELDYYAAGGGGGSGGASVFGDYGAYKGWVYNKTEGLSIWDVTRVSPAGASDADAGIKGNANSKINSRSNSNSKANLKAKGKQGGKKGTAAGAGKDSQTTFTHALLETPPPRSITAKAWRVVATVPGFAGWRVDMGAVGLLPAGLARALAAGDLRGAVGLVVGSERVEEGKGNGKGNGEGEGKGEEGRKVLTMMMETKLWVLERRKGKN